MESKRGMITPVLFATKDTPVASNSLKCLIAPLPVLSSGRSHGENKSALMPSPPCVHTSMSYSLNPSCLLVCAVPSGPSCV